MNAEALLTIADEVMRGRSRLVLYDAHMLHHVELIALALRFRQQPKSLVLRALVEDWSQERVVREIY